MNDRRKIIPTGSSTITKVPRETLDPPVAVTRTDVVPGFIRWCHLASAENKRDLLRKRVLVQTDVKYLP